MSIVLKSGEVYKSSTNNDEADLLQMLADYMAEFGGREPTFDELSKVPALDKNGKSVLLPKEINVYTTRTRCSTFAAAIAAARRLIPSEKTARRDEIIKKVAVECVSKNTNWIDDAMLSRLGVTKDELKRFFNGGVMGLKKEIEPSVRAEKVRRQRELRKQQEEVKPSQPLASTIVVPAEVLKAVETAPEEEAKVEPVTELKEEPMQVTDIEASERGYSVEAESDAVADDEYYYYEEDESVSIEPYVEYEGMETEETEPQPEPEAVPVIESVLEPQPKMAGSDVLNTLMDARTEDKFENYHFLCVLNEHIVPQTDLRVYRDRIKDEYKEEANSVLPNWDALQKHFGPCYKWGELFSLPYKSDKIQRMMERAKEQAAQKSNIEGNEKLNSDVAEEEPKVKGKEPETTAEESVVKDETPEVKGGEPEVEVCDKENDMKDDNEPIVEADTTEEAEITKEVKVIEEIDPVRDEMILIPKKKTTVVEAKIFAMETLSITETEEHEFVIRFSVPKGAHGTLPISALPIAVQTITY